MNKEFFEALDLLEKEKGIPKEYMLGKVEAALITAFKRERGGSNVRVLIDENKKEVKKGDVGELAVKGPGVMKCYYKDEAATNEVLSDGWLFTGDMAEEDKDGFIWLVDRKKDVIITGGENLYPVQIENFLRQQLPAIKDVAVIGLPDKRLGEIAVAVIETKEGFYLTEEEVVNASNGLPRYKRPRKIIFAEIPRNPTGKIEKPTLRKRYGSESLVAEATGAKSN